MLLLKATALYLRSVKRVESYGGFRVCLWCATGNRFWETLKIGVPAEMDRNNRYMRELEKKLKVCKELEKLRR